MEEERRRERAGKAEERESRREKQGKEEGMGREHENHFCTPTSLW